MSALSELTAEYEDASLRILSVLTDERAAQGFNRHTGKIIGEVNEVLGGLDSVAESYVRREVPKAYRAGMNASHEVVKEKKPDSRVQMRAMHKRAVNALSNNLLGDLQNANHHVGRKLEDEIRRISLGEVARSLTQHRSQKYTQERLIDKFQMEGLKTVSGMRIDRYAALVAKTTTQEATNLGAILYGAEQGFDLVQMNSYPTACPVCTTYQGRVYSIAGETTEYPALYETAFSRGYNIVHPKCGHSVKPYSIESAKDPEKDKEFSNRPFEDSRSRRQKELHDEQTAKVREEREKRLADEAELLRKKGAEREQTLEERVQALEKEVQRDIKDVMVPPSAIREQIKQVMAEGEKVEDQFYADLSRLGGQLTKKRAESSPEEARALVKQFSVDVQKLEWKRNEAKSRERHRIYLMISRNSPVDIVPNMTKKIKSGSNQQEIKNGFARFRSLVHPSQLPSTEDIAVKVDWTPTGRAHYDKPAIRIDDKTSASVVTHELGHWLEDNNPEMMKRSIEFLERRTQGEELQHLGEGYDLTEMTRPDRFVNSYMGKEYRDPPGDGDYYATEIVSMGLEQMMNNPDTFAERDPDYFDFVYSTVRGKGQDEWGNKDSDEYKQAYLRIVND